MELVSCLTFHKAFSSDLMENAIPTVFCYCLRTDIFQALSLQLTYILSAWLSSLMSDP